MSKSWKLVNQSGEPDFTGPMDIIIAGGTVVEITGEAVLDQRIKKGITERKGSNKFASWWGTTLRQKLGTKSLDTADIQQIGMEVYYFGNELIASQRRTAARLELSASEQLHNIDRVVVEVEQGKIEVSAQFITEASNSRRVSIVQSEVALDVTKAI